MNQPVFADNNLWKLIDQLRASPAREDLQAFLLSLAEGLREDPGVSDLLRRWQAMMLTAGADTYAQAALATGSAMTAEAQVTKPADATKPTLLQQYARLPCGQQLGVLTVILLAVLLLDPPPEVRDHIAYLIGLFSAAIWLGAKVTRS